MLRDPLVQTNPAILLAEDDPDQSEMLKDILEVEGFQVDTAFSGDMALKKMREHTYALAILDVRMPGLNGAEVLRRYRQTETGPRTPMVIVSAFATDAQMLQYKKDGADRGFSKPYDVEYLIAGIRELLSSHNVHANGAAAKPPPSGPVKGEGEQSWKA